MDKAEEILDVMSVANDEAAEVLQPSKQPFDLPAPAETPQWAPVLSGGPGTIAAMRSDQFNSVIGERKPPIFVPQIFDGESPSHGRSALPRRSMLAFTCIASVARLIDPSSCALQGPSAKMRFEFPVSHIQGGGMRRETGYWLRLLKRSSVACVALLAVSCASFQSPVTIDPGELSRGTYVIAAPGRYRLGGNAVAEGLATGASAIRIASSGVTLDLGGHTLSMPPGHSGANAGIEMNGVSGVTITNGTLQDITGAGIYLVCDVEPPNKPCANFSFTRLEMRNVGKTDEYGDLGNIFVRPFSGGIVVFGRSTPVPVEGGAWENSIDGVTVAHVAIRNDPGIKHMFSGSPPAGGQNGMTFASVSNLNVEDTRVTGMSSNDAAACIFLGRTKSVVVRRMNCNGATGDRNANGLDSMANVLKPLAIKKNYDVRVEDSSFVNIRATGARGNEALGVELNGEKFVFDRLLITDVVNDSTTGNGNRAIGIQIVSNNASKEVSYVTNCTVRNVTHHGNGRDSRAGGVSIETAPLIVVRGCNVTNVTNLATSTTSIKSFGYRVDPGANKVVFDGNVSDNVTAPTVASSAKPVAGYVAGFVLMGTEAELRHNRASRSIAGVYARKLAAPSMIQDNRFDCNRVGIDGDSDGQNYARNRLEGNAIPAAPAALLAKTDNIVAAANCGQN